MELIRATLCCGAHNRPGAGHKLRGHVSSLCAKLLQRIDRRDDAEYLVFRILKIHSVDVILVVPAPQSVDHEVSRCDRSRNIAIRGAAASELYGARRQVIQADPTSSI